MRSHEQKHLARILGESAQRIKDGLAQLRTDAAASTNGVAGEAPPEDVFASLEAVAKRLIDVEAALNQDVDRSRRRSPLKALRQWTSPRLGILSHHLPEPLRVPTSYLRTTPPSNPPRISIVTPSYAQGRYLGRTVYSVVNQRYPQLEYFVQDGGSQDETREVLERFDGELSGWVSEPDQGQADAINRGFAHTSGEIMAYLNSDDLLLPGSLAYVARYFAAHPDVDAVYGHRILIDEHDRQIGAWVMPPHDDETLTVADYVPQETLFWRRDLWERAGGLIDVSFKFAVDWDLLLRFRDAGARIVRLPRFLGAFRVHTEQKTGQQQELCEQESERLHRRVLGRAMSDEEIYARVQPYLRRHILYHTLYRLESRLPLPRSGVRTATLEEAREREAVSSFDLR
jgi:glycosyltransferase involved in cell wall biosynthesis